MLEPLPAPLLRDGAYDRIRDAILEGTLAPGAPLRPGELADALGLSLTPVREALARLRHEGLVQTRPRSGTRVTPLDLDGAKQALTVIAAMHRLAAETSVPRLTEADLAELAEAAEHFRVAVDTGDWHAAIDADDRFHGVFVRVAANRPLQETIERNMPLLRRAERLRFGTPPGRRSVTQHQRILRAARRGDAAAAADATLANWQSLVEQISASIARDVGD
jgi:DNA-binding GntR family transcriptional regulator